MNSNFKKMQHNSICVIKNYRFTCLLIDKPRNSGAARENISITFLRTQIPYLILLLSALNHIRLHTSLGISLLRIIERNSLTLTN